MSQFNTSGTGILTYDEKATIPVQESKYFGTIGSRALWSYRPGQYPVHSEFFCNNTMQRVCSTFFLYCAASYTLPSNNQREDGVTGAGSLLMEPCCEPNLRYNCQRCYRTNNRKRIGRVVFRNFSPNCQRRGN